MKSQKTSPAIDVIIPVHDRRQLLAEAVVSVLQQTWTGHIHLYIVEDGLPSLPQSHSGKSPERCANFSFLNSLVQKSQQQIPAQNNRSVYYIRTQEQKGPSAARNLGARLGNSEFIAFLDSDDLWHTDKISSQMKVMFEDPNVLWSHTNEAWFRDSKPVKQGKKQRKTGGRFLDRAFFRCLISPSAVVIRRAFWMNHGSFQETFPVGEDFELWLRLLFHAEIYFHDEPLTIKRAGNWPQLSSRKEIDRFRILALHRFCRLYRPEQHPEIPWQHFFESAFEKLEWLIRGAEKYSHPSKQRRYQSWSAVFNRLRTRAI